ncbi:MAG: hypothetical protein U5L04_05755 [Trueperaceae bacterium]|nr:hypothetical protein [Trueperaceae bacterium]
MAIAASFFILALAGTALFAQQQHRPARTSMMDTAAFYPIDSIPVSDTVVIPVSFSDHIRDVLRALANAV